MQHPTLEIAHFKRHSWFFVKNVKDLSMIFYKLH